MDLCHAWILHLDLQVLTHQSHQVIKVWNGNFQWKTVGGYLWTDWIRLVFAETLRTGRLVWLKWCTEVSCAGGVEIHGGHKDFVGHCRPKKD